MGRADTLLTVRPYGRRRGSTRVKCSQIRFSLCTEVAAALSYLSGLVMKFWLGVETVSKSKTIPCNALHRVSGAQLLT